MPRQETKFEVNQFTGGLNTDTTELTTPENSSTDELNFDLLKEGTRRRRRGMDLESATVTTLDLDGPTMFVGNHRWANVAKQGGVNFEVIQTGSTLRFYDSSNSTLVNGEKAFTVDLNDFKAPSATRTDLVGVSASSGKGALFVAGEAIRPFYIQYDPLTDTITTTELSLKIRDFDQLDTQSTESGTLTNERRYDLLNQGWYQRDVIIGSTTQIIKIKTKSSNPDTSVPGYDGTILDGYIETFNESPPKTKPWWVGKGTITVDIHIKKPGIFNDTKETREVEAFSKEAFDLYFGGNTLSPLGHYIVNPFYKDRSAVSGVTGLAAEVETRRPAAVSFYAGRAFYGLGNDIYISQVILDDFGAAERCYQEADPTAEDSIGLVPSDGGVVTIPDMGNIIRFFTLEGALLIFADNGIWALYSQQGEGFSISNFSVDFVTSVGATGYFNIVDVEGFPYYWSRQGIYKITPRQDGSIAFAVTEISADKIRNYYSNISHLGRQYAKGAYDSTNKVIIWLWKSSVSATDNRFLYDRVLNYSLVFDAFYPYGVAIHSAGDGNDKDKGVAGIVEANAFATTSTDIQVIAGDVDPYFDNIEFYYPLSTGTQYTDQGPNSLPDATPSGSGSIAVDGDMPLGSGYVTTTTTPTLDELSLPIEANIDEGTGDWTLEFRVTSDDWVAPPFTERMVMVVARTGTPAAPSAAYMKLRTIGSAFHILVDGDTGPELNHTTGSLITTDIDTFYFSFTRSGNTFYVHIDGNLITSHDVTGIEFNFTNGSGSTFFKFLGGGEEQSLPGTVGEIKWTGVAKYGASSYTVPFPTGISAGDNNVDSTSDGLVVITQNTVTESAIALKYIVLQNSTQTTTEAELGFGAFSDATSFKDWNTTGFGDDYTSYIETGYYLVDDAMRYIQAPWIYAYITRTSTTFPAAEGSGSIGSGEFGAPWTGT